MSPGSNGEKDHVVVMSVAIPQATTQCWSDLALKQANSTFMPDDFDSRGYTAIKKCPLRW